MRETWTERTVIEGIGVHGWFASQTINQVVITNSYEGSHKIMYPGLAIVNVAREKSQWMNKYVN